MDRSHIDADPRSPASSAGAGRWSRRIVGHHLPLAIATCLALLLMCWLVHAKDPRFRWSMATAYAGLALLGATLWVGPWHELRNRVCPVSTDFRRDLGLWAAGVGVAHVIIGIQVHMGNPWLYFFRQVGPAKHLVLRSDLFGWTNYAGLVATLLLVFLLALSNDWSLRVMGAVRWKAWQRANYILFALVAVHGVLFQVIEKRRTGWVITLGLMLAVVLGARLAAIVNARTPGLGRWPR